MKISYENDETERRSEVVATGKVLGERALESGERESVCERKRERETFLCPRYADSLRCSLFDSLFLFPLPSRFYIGLLMGGFVFKPCSGP